MCVCGRTPGRRAAGGKADGAGGGRWTQPEQRPLLRATFNDQQLQGNRFAAWEGPRVALTLSIVPERCRPAETGTLVFLHPGQGSSEEQVGWQTWYVSALAVISSPENSPV